jgi:stage II sporulation protein D
MGSNRIEKDNTTAPKTNDPSMNNTLNTLTYTVKKGETLSGIAKQLNVLMSDIIQTNNIKNPNVIKIDQQLIIPQKPQTSQQTPPSREQII